MNNTDYKILCIDDDKISLQVLEILLRDVVGIQNIETWLDSDRFIERLESQTKTPDFIFMDINIRPLNGYDMLKSLRQHPQLQDIRVIAVTAGVMPEQVNRLKEAGFNGLVSKPIARRLFPKIIEKLFKKDPIWYIS